MKKLHFIILLFALNATAQETYIYKSRGRIYQNGAKVSPEAIAVRFENNPEVLNLYKAGKTKQTLGNVLFWGGLGVGIIKLGVNYFNAGEKGIPEYNPSTNSFVRDKRDNILYYVSGAIIVAAIPIKIGFEKKIKKSVELMNEVAKNPKTTFNIESTQIIANRNGIGFAITF